MATLEVLIKHKIWSSMMHEIGSSHLLFIILFRNRTLSRDIEQKPIITAAGCLSRRALDASFQFPKIINSFVILLKVANSCDSDFFRIWILLCIREINCPGIRISSVLD